MLISQVAGLAKEIEKDSVLRDMLCPVTHGECPRGLVYDEDSKALESPCGATTPIDSANKSDSFLSGTPVHVDTSKRDPLTGSLHSSEKLKLMQLLDQWEEPDRSFDPNHVRSPCLQLLSWSRPEE